MWKTKLCLALSGLMPTPEEEILLLHRTGFDGFFTVWKPSAPVKTCKRLADALDMEYQSIHAPFLNAANMWSTNHDVSQPAVKELIDCLHVCADNEIPIMVVHAFTGFGSHSPNEEGVHNFETVIKEAECLGVRIAFENLEGEEYLAAVMQLRSTYSSIGFCWDTGHEMCYNHGQDMPAMYGDVLICTHLNDNLGIRDFNGNITFHDDLHLLPFDGIADWDDIASRLVRSGFDGPLTFELTRNSKPERHDNDLYRKMAPEEYAAEAFKRACRLAVLLQRKQQGNPPKI